MKPLTEMKGNNDVQEKQEKTGGESKIDRQTDTPKPCSSSVSQLGLYTPTQIMCPSDSPVGMS